MRRKQDGIRIYGPYQHGEQWRVHEVETSGGRRHTTYHCFETIDEAEAFINAASGEAQGDTVKSAVDAFLDAKRRRGLADVTIDNYEHRLNRLLGLPKNGNRPLRWVRDRGDQLYQASVFGAGDTHINGLNVGRMWGNFCVKQRMLRANPFADVEAVGRKRHGSTKERLSVNESRKLEAYCCAHADEQDCVLTYGYLMLGKRASELAGALVRDLDDDGRLLRIRKAKSVASVGSIAVPEVLREMMLGLAEGRALDAPLFANTSGEPMSRYSARDRVRAVTKAAIGREVPPQELRRTFTDNAGRQGIALKSIAEMTGHTSPSVTRRSYIGRDVVDAAAVERNFKVLAGGAR